jgi:hypothetical protein
VHLFPPGDAIRWRLGGGTWADRIGRFQNPPTGASIYYFLKDKAKGELKLEILLGDKVVRTLSSVPREPDNSSEDEDPEELKKAALATDAGVQRAVWDLTWEGARKIRGGKIDTGDPATGPRAIPGTYQVRLSVDGTTRTASLRVTADPRGNTVQSDLEAQLSFALRVRDDVSKLTDLVNRIRSVRDQLQARSKALQPRKSEGAVADLLKYCEEVIKKADSLEGRLHNPTAEVVYDILAMRGGTRLYSRLAPLQMWATEAQGSPTAGMKQVLEEQEKELDALSRETDQFVRQDVAQLNELAAKLSMPFVNVK